jgi:hypothetical protein
MFYRPHVLGLKTSEPPRLRTGANNIVSLLHYAYYIHINLPLESDYLLKKRNKIRLGVFKDLSIHKD